MNVALRPEVRKYIADQVAAGRFASPDELVEAAVGRMMADAEFELDDETVAAINLAEQQLDRGEGIPFEDFAADMRRKIADK